MSDEVSTKYSPFGSAEPRLALVSALATMFLMLRSLRLVPCDPVSVYSFALRLTNPVTPLHPV